MKGDKEIIKEDILEEDGVYIHKCDNTECNYHDDRGFCRFEACVIEAVTFTVEVLLITS